MLGRPGAWNPVFMKSLAGAVVEDIGGHAAKPDDFVDDLAVVGEKFAE
jgi:hypothetical protein